MTTKLEALQNLIIRLHVDYGIVVVCVGGAARDTYLGREPKDYDLVVLTPTGNTDDLREQLLQASGAFSIAELGKHDIEDYVKEDSDRGLRHVFEFNLDVESGVRVEFPLKQPNITVQVLVFSEEVTKRYAHDPYNVVEDHDCDLNKAWFEEVNGKLRARVHPEFPSPFTGNVNNFQPGYNNHVRKTYMQDKFPEYQHR